MLRAIPAAMDSSVVAEIDLRLEGIAREHHVKIPLAIESGSRAWGFPSPDSDYDCRFIFVQSLDNYLSLFPSRDVIETPLIGKFDVNGWDLAKAIRLLLKGNAVVIEWLTSPIVYAADEWFRSAFLALAERAANRDLIARHYLHLGQRQRGTSFADEREFPLKRIFYALRPAAALRWLELHPDKTIAPMHFPALLAGCDPPQDVAALVEGLIARKAVTNELGAGPVPVPISKFIDSEFASAQERLRAPPTPVEGAKAEAQAFLMAALAHCQILPAA